MLRATPVVRVEPTTGWVPLDLGELWEYRELLYFFTWRDVAVLSGVVDFVIAFTMLGGLIVYYRIEPSSHVVWVPSFFLLAVVTCLGALPMSSRADLALHAVALGKRYRLGAPKPGVQTAREALIALARAAVRSPGRSRGATTMWALKGITFDVPQGEVVGLIGLNGAGKSTLLKLLSRIAEPTEGYADIPGRVGSLLEVGTGFHSELSGRENIYLNGAILGLKKAEIAARFDDIVLLGSVPRTSRITMDDGTWYWHCTTHSAHRLVTDVFPESAVTVTAAGNAAAAVAFLHGLAAEELPASELDRVDPEYEVVITMRATRQAE